MTPQPMGPLGRRLAKARGIEVAEPPKPEPARKPAQPFVPAWRRNLTDRDETGRVLA